MKRRLLALLMVTAMAVSVFTACTSDAPADDNTKTEAPAGDETNEEGETQYVSPEDTVDAKDVHVVDVRLWENYVAGRVANSEWCPAFPLEDATLDDSMKAYAEANLTDGKDVYIICNSGARGAERATAAFLAGGVEASKLYTVEGGAKALAEVDGALTTARYEEAIEWGTVTGQEAVDATDVQIVDVRDADAYAEGHLEGSINIPMGKEFESADAQTTMFEEAKKLDLEKDVYFVCYSGNKVAKTAISVFKDAGFSLDKLFIITGGAGDAAVSGAFVK